VERRPEGDFAVRRPDAERASAVVRTQAEAIARARELNPNKTPLVERVRYTNRGKPDLGVSHRPLGKLKRGSEPEQWP
jgi:hypothetical protein